MSSYPRRSARLSPHTQQEQYQQRSASAHSMSPYSQSSQSSSTATSSYPSPIADNAHPPPPPPTPHQGRLQIQSQLMPQFQQQHAYAPLPSPAAGEMQPFFSRPHSEPNAYASQQQTPMTLGPQHRQTQQHQFGGPMQHDQQTQHGHMHPHANSISQQHSDFTTMSSGQIPSNFVSLEEAAKRAQLACMMRDFGDVSL